MNEKDPLIATKTIICKKVSHFKGVAVKYLQRN